MVDLRLLVMEVEFGWVGGGVGGGGGGGGVQSHFHVKPNSVEVVLRLSWGCDKNKSCRGKFKVFGQYNPIIGFGNPHMENVQSIRVVHFILV